MARLSQLLRCLIRNTAEKGFPGDKTRLISKIKQQVCMNNCRQLLAVRTYFLRGQSTNTRHAYNSTSLLSKPVSPENEYKDTKMIYDLSRTDVIYDFSSRSQDDLRNLKNIGRKLILQENPVSCSQTVRHHILYERYGKVRQ